MATILRPGLVASEIGSPEHVRLTGVAFLSLGLASIMLPVVTGLPTERLATLLLIFWGSGGVLLAIAARQQVYRLAFLSLAVFGLAAGLFFAIAGTSDTARVATLLAVVFAGQGLAGLLLGLRLRKSAPDWSWLVFCGGVSVALAYVLLTISPATTAVTFAAFVTLNFMSTGLALVRLSRR